MGAKKIPAEIIAKIREKLNLVDIVGETVSLKKTGHNLVGLCPFHSERTPSFTVHETKNLFHCHGCKAGGDLFAYVQKLHGLSFMEAVVDLAERAQVKIPSEYTSDSDDPQVAAQQAAFREKIRTAHKLNLFVTQLYRKQLAQDESAKSYLAKRGVSPEEMKAFQVGLATESWDNLSRHLIQAKAPLPLAQDLGLIKASTKRTGDVPYFDLFRDRVMFPIINQRGHVVAFGGRTLGAKTDGPKFLNSSDSFLYKKGENLFGLFQAQKFIREQDSVLVVEGYFDVVTLHSYGIRNVVAVCGTALTPDHLKQLRKLASKVIVLFDADRAGQDGAEKAMIMGMTQGFVIHGMRLPTTQDPDEFVMDSTQGPEALKKLMSEAQPLIDTKIQEGYLESQKGSQQKVDALKNIKEWLSQFKDPIGLEVRWNEVEKIFGIKRHSLGVGVPLRPQNQAALAPSAMPKPQVKAGPQKPLQHFERVILTGLIRWADYAALFLECKQMLPTEKKLYDAFEHTGAKAFATDLISSPGYYDQLRSSPDWAMEKVQDPQVLGLVIESLMADSKAYDVAEMKVALHQGIFRIWARFSHELKSRIAQAEARQDRELQEKLLKDYLDVQRKMKEFQGTYDQVE